MADSQAAPASHAAAVQHGAASGRLTPEEAIRRLLEGNRRYTGNLFYHPEALSDRRSELARDQHPFAIVLGCADSRVPPEVIFDQGLGDLFVIRVAGNIPSPHVLGSIEYAVEHLGSSLIVVLGHERCGAVKAAVEGGEAPGHIGSLVRAIKPAVDEIKVQRPTSPEVEVDLCVRNNVAHGVQYILDSSPVVAKAVKTGRVKLVGARYDLDTGVVDLLP